MPWRSDCRTKIDGQKDSCTCVCVSVWVSVLLREEQGEHWLKLGITLRQTFLFSVSVSFALFGFCHSSAASSVSSLRPCLCIFLSICLTLFQALLIYVSTVSCCIPFCLFKNISLLIWIGKHIRKHIENLITLRVTKTTLAAGQIDFEECMCVFQNLWLGVSAQLTVCLATYLFGCVFACKTCVHGSLS